MKFIPAAIGAALLIAALNLGKISVWGVECYYYGKPNDLDDCYGPGFFYTLIILGAALLVVTGVLLFKAQMEERQFQQRHYSSSDLHYSSGGASPSYSAKEQSAIANPAWKTLKEFDADIKAAVAQLAAFGPQAEKRLADAYLSVNDKSLLPSMVATIVEESKDKAEQKNKFIQELAMEREKRARFPSDDQMGGEKSFNQDLYIKK